MLNRTLPGSQNVYIHLIPDMENQEDITLYTKT